MVDETGQAGAILTVEITPQMEEAGARLLFELLGFSESGYPYSVVAPLVFCEMAKLSCSPRLCVKNLKTIEEAL